MVERGDSAGGDLEGLARGGGEPLPLGQQLADDGVELGVGEQVDRDQEPEAAAGSVATRAGTASSRNSDCIERRQPPELAGIADELRGIRE